MSQAASPQVRPERIAQYAWGYAAPLILETAVRLGVFDALDAGPRPAEDLAKATQASARGLRMVLNALVGFELLTKDAQGRYALTPESSTFLVSSRPGYLGGFLKHTSSQLIPKWLQLTEVVRTGKPAMAVNRQGDGTAFFHQFVADLFPFNYATAKVLGEALQVPAAQKPLSVLDVAAGSGVWGIALAQQSPLVRVTAVDWPGVLDVARRMGERHGVKDRMTFVEGDIASADFGSGHDIATLGHILHSEGAERSEALLRRVAAALAPGGTVAIAEWLVNDERTGPANGLVFAVNMLVNTDAGDTFSFNEISRWLTAAGFTNPRTLDAPGPSPLVLATKPK